MVVLVRSTLEHVAGAEQRNAWCARIAQQQSTHTVLVATVFVLLHCSLQDGNLTAVYSKPFDMLANGVSHQRRRPFVEEFRTFCLSNPSAPNTALGLGDTLEELLASTI